MKTYSKRPAAPNGEDPDERPHKRIRMSETGSIIEERFGGYEEEAVLEEETLGENVASLQKTESKKSRSSSISTPSSPVLISHGLFSSDAAQDEESELSSLPSSPPPLPLPVPTVRKPAFSFLKRKRSTLDDASGSQPLSDITDNARKIPRLGKKDLTQTKIDLGGDVRKTCRTCGMEYIPSVREDSALHSRFCAMNVGGVDMSKAFLRDDSVKRIHSERTRNRDKDMVVVVDRKSSLAARNGIRKVLGVVNAELSSADINDSQLWEALDTEDHEIDSRKSARKKVFNKPKRHGDRFKAFLYMVGDKCVGLCLAEKISHAYPVIETECGEDFRDAVKAVPKSSSRSVATTADVALIGVSRIWTSKSYRGHGLAMDLLECARSNFFFGVEAPKSLVAFSQPTESGGRLAEYWFERKMGWHIYCGL